MLPHDSLEGITWGLQWQWGYNKHPFLSAWLLAAFSKLATVPDFSVYVLAQLAVALTFIAVWRLARYFLPPIHALIASAVLDGVFFYNINSFNFTPDTLQSPLWALFSLCFFLALRKEAFIYWILTAVVAFLALMAKYQFLILLACAFLFTLFDARARQCYKNKTVYLAMILFLLLLTPHLYWLWKHDFITLQYAFGTAADYSERRAHFYYPLKFILNCLGGISGLIVLLWPFYRSQKMDIKLDSFQWNFLIFIGLGPFLLTLLLNIISGEYYPARWATPYFFMMGILFLATLKPVLNKKNMKRFVISLLLFSSLLGLGRFSLAILKPRVNSDAWLPDKQLAVELASLWQKNCQKPLKYLVGSHYLVATVVPYMNPKPIPFMSWSGEDSPWVNILALKEQGALFVWDLDENYVWDQSSKHSANIPDNIQQQFPGLKMLGIYTFHRQIKQPADVRVAIAILPPIKKNEK